MLHCLTTLPPNDSRTPLSVCRVVELLSSSEICLSSQQTDFSIPTAIKYLQLPFWSFPSLESQIRGYMLQRQSPLLHTLHITTVLYYSWARPTSLFKYKKKKKLVNQIERRGKKRFLHSIARLSGCSYKSSWQIPTEGRLHDVSHALCPSCPTNYD